MPKKKQSPSSDKAMRPAEDKLARDQAALERDFDPERDLPPTRPPDHKTVTCYNPACADYRRPRVDGSACSCRRTAIGSLT